MTEIDASLFIVSFCAFIFVLGVICGRYTISEIYKNKDSLKKITVNEISDQTIELTGSDMINIVKKSLADHLADHLVRIIPVAITERKDLNALNFKVVLTYVDTENEDKE